MSNFSKHIIIVGTARSGTSWLSETIAQQSRYRLLFEPEHETQTKRGHLICDQFIENREASQKAHQYLKQVFANRVDCDWIAQHSNRKFKMHLWPIIPKKFIFKFVRANLSAGYMNASFKIPVIHMIRNPYDVIHSQLKVKFPWLTDLSHFAAQPNLVKLIKDRSKIDITDLSNYTKLERLALRWCIENVIPLEVSKSYTYKYSVVRYEDLFSDIQVFYDLCRRFDLEYISTIEEAYKKPSSKTHHKSSIITNVEKQSSFSEYDLSEINWVLTAFQTKLYPIID